MSNKVCNRIHISCEIVDKFNFSEPISLSWKSKYECSYQKNIVANSTYTMLSPCFRRTYWVIFLTQWIKNKLYYSKVNHLKGTFSLYTEIKSQDYSEIKIQDTVWNLITTVTTKNGVVMACNDLSRCVYIVCCVTVSSDYPGEWSKTFKTQEGQKQIRLRKIKET